MMVGYRPFLSQERSFRSFTFLLSMIFIYFIFVVVIFFFVKKTKIMERMLFGERKKRFSQQ
jgi:ABC-type phosphate transport system permease subunit